MITQQLNIRLEKSLVEEIDKRGKRREVIRGALKQYFESEREDLMAENRELKGKIELMANHIKDLESQLGFLNQQYSLITQRMLEPPEKIKRRWKFWKR